VAVRRRDALVPRLSTQHWLSVQLRDNRVERQDRRLDASGRHQPRYQRVAPRYRVESFASGRRGHTAPPAYPPPPDTDRRGTRDVHPHIPLWLRSGGALRGQPPLPLPTGATGDARRDLLDANEPHYKLRCRWTPVAQGLDGPGTRGAA
jgi:hypothetical protein